MACVVVDWLGIGHDLIELNDFYETVYESETKQKPRNLFNAG